MVRGKRRLSREHRDRARERETSLRHASDARERRVSDRLGPELLDAHRLLGGRPDVVGGKRRYQLVDEERNASRRTTAIDAEPSSGSALRPEPRSAATPSALSGAGRSIRAERSAVRCATRSGANPRSPALEGDDERRSDALEATREM